MVKLRRLQLRKTQMDLVASRDRFADLYDFAPVGYLTLDDAAEALGLSRRMLAYYRSGAKPVPRVVELAITGWEHEHEAA